MSKPIALVVGVGPATGQAVCRRLAGTYELVMIARSSKVIGPLADELPDAHAYEADVSQREEWPATLRRIVGEVGLPSRILVNTESAPWGAYNQLDIEAFSASFEVSVVGLLQMVQTLFPQAEQILPDTRIVVSSSPAAYNPPPSFLGLAPSRVAQRVLVELLSENLGDSGLHFSVLSIDGAIDEAKMRALMPDKPTSCFIQPSDIADRVVKLFSGVEFPIAAEISGPSSFGNRT